MKEDHLHTLGRVFQNGVGEDVEKVLLPAKYICLPKVIIWGKDQSIKHKCHGDPEVSKGCGSQVMQNILKDNSQHLEFHPKANRQLM